MGLNSKSRGNSIKQWILFILWTSMKPIDNSQIPCGESVKLLTFLGHFFATLVIGQNVLTQKKTLSKWSWNTFHRVNGLSVGLSILSVKIRTFLCGKAPCRISKQKGLPIIALNFSYYEFFISIHSWLMLAMIAKNRKLGFLLTLKQKSPESIRVQMTSFSFREWISTDIHTIAWASFPEWILIKNHPRSECIVF